MESFNKAWSLDDLNEEEDEYFFGNSRDACIFILDMRLKQLDLVCKACSAQVQERLIANPKDRIGIVIINSEQVMVYRELSAPSIDLVKDLESFDASTIDNDVNDKGGFNLNEVIWNAFTLKLMTFTINSLGNEFLKI
ncbi:hypothetical protein GJ496_004300 [Pomphorhynchus laevis]|nr:hypothetical protein GJ496_006609 [Pomphorhynchus laevis]KAI0988208.1 hypothetical protein GJ496_004300 [Pomphorhynchus laevis]